MVLRTCFIFVFLCFALSSAAQEKEIRGQSKKFHLVEVVQDQALPTHD